MNETINNGAAANKRMDTKKMVTMALLAAIAYAVMVVGRIPIVSFLKYDPKDVIIAISGFIYGPFSAFLISLVVSIIEMVTVSDTGPWGLLMNVLSTCAFVCPAAWIYKKHHTIKGAVIGLVVGAVAMVLTMMLWNYLITPIYMGVSRQKVVELLIPVFLPFNLLKAGLNATITIFLYKPVVRALRKTRLIEQPAAQAAAAAGGRKYGVIIATAAVFISFVLFALVLSGVIG